MNLPEITEARRLTLRPGERVYAPEDVLIIRRKDAPA